MHGVHLSSECRKGRFVYRWTHYKGSGLEKILALGGPNCDRSERGVHTQITNAQKSQGKKSLVNLQKISNW